MIAVLLLSIGVLVGVVATGLAAELREENVWTDSQGRRLSEATVFSYNGPEHCGWQDVVFLEIGYQSGLTQPGLSGRLNFLRDSEGVLSSLATAPFQSKVALPANALDTSWRRDGHELWLDPEGAAAYVRVDGDEFERWPRTRGDIACA